MNITQTECPRTTDPTIVDAIILDDPWFDPVKLLKIVGIEFWHHLLLSLVTVAWLPRLVGPLATIISGERYPASIWTSCSVALLLMSYGFFVGKSSKGYRITRVLMQSSFYVLVAMVSVAISPAAFYTAATTVAWIVGSLAAGALIGCCFVSTKVKPVKPKQTDFITVALIGVRLVVGFAIGIGGLYLLMSLGTVAQSSLYVDKPAPKTSYATVSGETWTFDEHKGKVILVEFWAPYCGPCVAAFPELKQTYKRFNQHDDFEMVSVTSLSMEEWATEMFEDKQAPWTLLFRPEEAGPNDLAPYSIPAAYIIDRDGKIVAAHIRGAAVERELEKLFDE